MNKNITPTNLDDILALDPAPRASHVARTLANLDKRITADTDRTYAVVAPVVGSLLEGVRPGKADRVEGMSYTWNSQRALADDLGISGADVTTLKRLAMALEVGVEAGSDLWRSLVKGRTIGMAEFFQCDTFEGASDYAAAVEAYRQRGTTADPVAGTPDASVEAATQGAKGTAPDPTPTEDVRAPQMASEAGVDPRKSPVDALSLIMVEVNAGRLSKTTRRALVKAVSELADALDNAR